MARVNNCNLMYRIMDVGNGFAVKAPEAENHRGFTSGNPSPEKKAEYLNQAVEHARAQFENQITEYRRQVREQLLNKTEE